jgi:hypothetical protein
MLNPTCVYHPDHPVKTVSAEEAKELYKKGWYDTPAKFPVEKPKRTRK